MKIGGKNIILFSSYYPLYGTDFPPHFDTFFSILFLSSWLATMYPNRTAKWGRCCDQPKHKLLHEFLDHPKTLMVVIGQHSNISHPKVLTIPRGLPLNWRHTEQMVWDSLRTVQHTVKKNKLLFASASSWGPRPQILRCVSAKMSPNDFEGHDQTPKTEMDKTRQDRKVISYLTFHSQQS